MKTIDLNSNIIRVYFELLVHLSNDLKLDLITRLLSSMKTGNVNKKKSILELYGAWASDIPAEQLAEEIRSARVFNRKIEEL